MKAVLERKNIIKLQQPLIILIFWLLLFASPLFFGNAENGIDWTHIFNIWLMFIPYLAVFLINRFVLLPLLFFSGKRLYYFITTIALILILSVAASNIMNMRDSRPVPMENMTKPPRPLNSDISPMGERPGPPPNAFEDKKPPGPPPNAFKGRKGPGAPPNALPPFLGFFVISTLIVGFDTGLVTSVRYAQSEQKRISAEKENALNKLAFLQNQVSPHFFMNTLNNIHSQIDLDTDEAKESLIKLSKLMRHLLYDSQGEQIALQKEINFVKSYVELMQLRYSDKVKIDLIIPDNLPDKSIPPLLFTSFVENAFKHGISYQEYSFIEIEFSYKPGELNFRINNSNHGSNDNSDASGIGLENSRKRLALLYGDKYALDITDLKEIFIINLSIPV